MPPTAPAARPELIVRLFPLFHPGERKRPRHLQYEVDNFIFALGAAK